MLTGGAIFAVATIYVGVLFAIAYYADQRADAGRSLSNNPYVYALSMAVYCTAWTFYGSVGQAARTGIGFLPIYIGPTLMAALWWFVLRKIIRISKVNRITSIADLIASRYGKSPVLGGLVAIIALLGTIPYISLQLKAISTSFTLLWTHPDLSGAQPIGDHFFVQNTAFYVAMLLAGFAILFGTRHLDVTEHHEGLVTAIAFESLIKLLAFLAVGLFVTFGMYNGFGDLFNQTAAVPALRKLFIMAPTAGAYSDWAWLTFLSMMAILFLPRQFQVSVVENIDERHLNKAIWLFPLYLLAINIFVLPIAFGGLLHFPDGAVDADTFVLTLPMSEGYDALAMLVFLGGFSAATGMVIVASVALSTMLCNDLVMPLLLRWRSLRLHERRDLSQLLLRIRRVTIVLILLLGYFYFQITGESGSLVSIGLISFAATAQFAPAILGGIYWKGGAWLGALTGLIGGFLVWGYTLPLPSMAAAGWLPETFVEMGPLGIGWLKPYALFGLTGMSPIAHGLFWSMTVNIGAYMIVSLLSSQNAAEHSQATLFVDIFHYSSTGEAIPFWRGSASVAALRALLERFLGQGRADQALAAYARRRGLDWTQHTEADAELVAHAEKLLAGTIGAASANVAIASVVTAEPLSVSEVMRMVEETSQVIAYSRQLEQRSHQLELKSLELETATQELKSANERLQELDRLKDDFIATVTHELRTPLTSIRAFSEILHDNPELDLERRNGFLEIVLKESERLTRLINQVLDLSKLESGAADWQVQPVDLRTLIQESLDSLGQLFQEKGVALKLNLTERDSICLADRDRIMQVMLNLLSNAIKFSPAQQGVVCVSLQNNSGWLRVDVSDNGPGIAPAQAMLIFDKFRQVGDTLTGKPQGTGLGLPISKQIVSHLGGELWVESQVGHGANFAFILPVHSSNAH
ncbi:MAG: histidine kinase [Caldilineaceae bacterium]|nr:histidine kinase [Caldilineaceae bacterium]MCB0094279.1 histidine kinase [Caldilineaceae bacterium]MCB9157708.1 histidine kinase [Caldilineaceae bacterium]